VRPRARASWWLFALGAVLAVGLLLVAQPGQVLALALRARWPGLLAALLGTLALTVVRGGRLALLAGQRLPAGRATGVAALAQLASGVLPMRLGELALVPLLQFAGVPGTVRGLSLLVLGRVLDLGALLTWALFAGALIGGSPAIAFAGAAVLVPLLVLAAAVGLRGLRRIAGRWRQRHDWRRRLLLQLLRVRGELRLAARSPLRAWGSVALSLLVWGLIWVVTAALLRAMLIDWPPGPVLLGVVGAALGSSLPVNTVGNFGTQEVGWAAALAAAGVPTQQALAAGFACHLWILLFSVVVGAAAAAYLAALRPGSPPNPLLAVLKSVVSTRRGA
jgi:hypothetical protein